MTPRQVELWARALGALVLIHSVGRDTAPEHRATVGADLSADAMRELYGGIPGVTWGRPGMTLDEELEQYAMLDLAFAQLQGMERAAFFGRRRAGGRS